MPLEIGDGCDVLQSFNENLEKKNMFKSSTQRFGKIKPRIARETSKKKKTCLKRQLKNLKKKKQGFFEILQKKKKKPKASNTEFKSLLHSSEVFFSHEKKRKNLPQTKGPPDTMGATSSTEAISAPIGVEVSAKETRYFLGRFQVIPSLKLT